MRVFGWISKILLLSLLLGSFLEGKTISKETKKELKAYMLPEDHPIKSKLDSIFSESRATFNLESLEKAGFKKTKPRKFTKLIVTKHPEVPGYIFKLYLDAQRYRKDKPEHHFWLLRLKGAEKIRQEIEDQDVGSLFKVPQKWIYNLPTTQLPPKGYQTKHFILVEEDMEILSDKANKAAWKSSEVTHEQLSSLFAILKKVGLRDCTKPDNVPFSKDGRIAFIDTQTYGQKVNFKRMLPYLSKSNQEYWKVMAKEKRIKE